MGREVRSALRQVAGFTSLFKRGVEVCHIVHAYLQAGMGRITGGDGKAHWSTCGYTTVSADAE